MLRSMVLENFQSFSQIELDLSGKNRTVKNHAFIYGENGSGKSNLINALFLLKVCSGELKKVISAIENDAETSQDDDIRQLAKDLHMIGSDGNMKLSYTFSIKGTDATYYIEFSQDGTIVKEVLENKINQRRGVLFRLESGEDPYFVRGLIKDKRFRDKIKSEIAQYWGNRSILTILNKDIRESNLSFIIENVNGNLLDFLYEINTMSVETKSFPILMRGPGIEKGIIKVDRAGGLEVVQEVMSSFFSRLYTDVVGAYFKTEYKGEYVEYELFFKKRISGTIRDIPASWESTGTKKLMGVLSPILSCINGGCVFIDEMDTGVHDLLISGIMEQAIPEIKGQLVATTHNTCLMDDLDADHVFVIGVDMNGYKKIRCVSSIERIRKANSIRHKYYDGNFMGIPYIADLALERIAGMGKVDE